jgi:hypothetical protein
MPLLYGLIVHTRGLIGDKGEVVFPHLTLTETVGIFPAILLDLRVPLCYDSIKDVPNFQRFNQ